MGGLRVPLIIMKKALLALPLLLTLSAFAPLAAEAAGFSRPGGVKERKCYKEVYREEYIPGTKRNPGYVRRWTDRRRVPCNQRPPRRDWMNEGRPHVDDNSCVEGAVLGGIAGGGLGAALSRDEGNLIGIPLGIVGGALVGCQIDGG